MTKYLAIQHTYDTFEIALFINHKLVDKISDDKRHTSKLFIPHLQQLLSKNAISFAELSFCAVNCGPGPFSTLRSIIASDAQANRRQSLVRATRQGQRLLRATCQKMPTS